MKLTKLNSSPPKDLVLGSMIVYDLLSFQLVFNFTEKRSIA